MKQSNTSHNKNNFGGVLQPLLETLTKNRTGSGRLAGKEVIINRQNIETIIALDKENNIHLLISPAKDDARFLQLKLRGLKIDNKKWQIANQPARSYLDISCSTGILPSFKRPFLRFAEDILFEISNSSLAPCDAVYHTGVKWRKFWSSDSSGEVSVKWLHGIFGELSFLYSLIKKFGPDVIQSWNGPVGSDHDFQAGTDLAAEIKTSTEMPFKIHCNIRQLDNDIYKKLYLICYHIATSKNGKILPDLVKEIEQLIGNDKGGMLDIFYERLASAGYERQQEDLYATYPVKISPAHIFLVDKSFPKITESCFSTKPDNRINDIRYTLRITGIKKLTFDSATKNLQLFAKL